jgi:hypothetical protein
MVLGQILTRYTPFKEKKSNVIEGGMWERNDSDMVAPFMKASW